MKAISAILATGVLIFITISCIYAGRNLSIEETNKMKNNTPAEKSKPVTDMVINVTASGNTTVFNLNNSQAAKDLYAQLPLEIAVENFSNNEKIFYPPQKLKTDNTPLADKITAGTLAYYAPWGDVVMFYGSFHKAPGLYALGSAISGSEYIKKMSGKIRIEKSNINENE